MNSLFCVVLFGISSSVYSLNSSEVYNFTLLSKKSTKSYRRNYTGTSGSTLRFVCYYSDGRSPNFAWWLKEDCRVSEYVINSGKCRVKNDPYCRNVTVPSNIECDTNTSIKIYNVSVEDSGGWRCRYLHSRTQDFYSETYNVEIKARTPPPKPFGTGSSTHQMEDTSINSGTTVNDDELTTIHQPAQPTGSEPASNNYLFLVVGAAVCGVLILNLVAAAVSLKRKKTHKGGRKPVAPNDDIVPEVEDGQYESIGRMKPSVAAGPVIERNLLYESYEDNNNRNRNQNQDGLTQDGECDVYSVVNKPGRSAVQEAPSVDDTGGDMYSVVQKKRQDPPAIDGVHAGTPDLDISDVYSVVQKPGKTQR